MSAASASRPERPGDGEGDGDLQRRHARAVEVIADGLLTMLVRARLVELDAEDTEGGDVAEAHPQTSERRVPVAGRARSSAVSTSRDESPAAR